MNEYSFRIWHDQDSNTVSRQQFSEFRILAMVVATVDKSGRTATRERRRQQLIDATMKCIARKGMASATLSDVAKEAGLSQGIVNLHFESKDNLLTETLRHLADEYKTQFNKAFEKSGPGPAEKLLALMEMDLRPSICDRGKIAVWFAFWGEVKFRPTYRKICDESDRYYDAIVEDLCSEIISDGAYKTASASAIANALTSMTNGFWLSCLISPQTWNRAEAMEAVLSYLRSLYQKHYD
jgi:TetR/AcrR family transcriptional repressor of bet genes